METAVPIESVGMETVEPIGNALFRYEIKMDIRKWCPFVVNSPAILIRHPLQKYTYFLNSPKKNAPSFSTKGNEI